MIVHVPPNPRYRPLFLIGPGVVFFLATLSLSLSRATVPATLTGAARFGLCLAPPLGLLAWHFLGAREFRATNREELGPVPPAQEGPGGAPRSSRLRVLNEEHRPFSLVVEDGQMAASQPTVLRLLSLRRAEVALWWHPMMLLHYVAAAAAAWILFRSGWGYLEYLIVPVIGIWTFVVLVWLVLGSPWAVIEVVEGQGALDDVSGYSFLRAFERTRILEAAPAEEDVVVTLEREGPVRLQFPGGSLARRMQQEFVLGALRSQGTAPAPAEAGAGSKESGDEVHE